MTLTSLLSVSVVGLALGMSAPAHAEWDWGGSASTVGAAMGGYMGGQIGYQAGGPAGAAIGAGIGAAAGACAGSDDCGDAIKSGANGIANSHLNAAGDGGWGWGGWGAGHEQGDPGGGPDSGGASGGIGCFPASTPVWMADGTQKPIEEVSRGDKVMALNTDGEQVVGTVMMTHFHPYMPLYAQDGLQVSAEQPMKLAGGAGYKRVRELQPGDQLLRVDGTHVVKEVYPLMNVDPTRIYTSGGALILTSGGPLLTFGTPVRAGVYNLTIDEEAYAVGEEGIWAHNIK